MGSTSRRPSNYEKVLAVLAQGQPLTDADVGEWLERRARRRRWDATRGPDALRRDPEVRAYICGRDGWTCWRCGSAVDHRYRSPDPRTASMDHVLPLVGAGGTDSLDNIKLAHLFCNMDGAYRRRSKAEAAAALAERIKGLPSFDEES
jgi:hypothetical protein